MLQKSDNSPTFNLYFYEYAECLIAVCFRIFPKVSLENVRPFGVLPPQRTTAVARFRDAYFQVCFPPTLTTKHTLPHLTEAFPFLLL